MTLTYFCDIDTYLKETFHNQDLGAGFVGTLAVRAIPHVRHRFTFCVQISRKSAARNCRVKQYFVLITKKFFMLYVCSLLLPAFWWIKLHIKCVFAATLRPFRERRAPNVCRATCMTMYLSVKFRHNRFWFASILLRSYFRKKWFRTTAWYASFGICINSEIIMHYFASREFDN